MQPRPLTYDLMKNSLTALVARVHFPLLLVSFNVQQQSVSHATDLYGPKAVFIHTCKILVNRWSFSAASCSSVSASGILRSLQHVHQLSEGLRVPPSPSGMQRPVMTPVSLYRSQRCASLPLWSRPTTPRCTMRGQATPTRLSLIPDPRMPSIWPSGGVLESLTAI